MPDPLFTAAKLLESHGYAVVELPKPVGVNGTDNTVWLSDPYIEQEFNGDITVSNRLGIDADELEDVAAALLAAARRHREEVRRWGG
ncbi:hypothetical protein [Mycobacteroides abscessus]|uniref:Uncharacterized protein n=1 Tax=Mycobacteroides abscessus subsp. massiliense TaxID=1962118 RepID=A0A1U0YA85_9MYCO|nr:hypothetical protein [Mycobacteroides abscessus]SKL37858.1 Uncharacterised protein [Mycobacteroides abscessus subsp. massiliense]SKS56945.1 Uncharacterised protein [Mycobacteroides abscessus subsp. massiliense]SKT51091.1 Uncharacterised protein [Mycobacteroides abscessus subsp. massiliense]SKX00280.1 Uncharacterised protein [Mycobacteroides abscessus subsp. massiliense]